MSASSSLSSGSSNSGVPRVGGVRCYWALLTPRYPAPSGNGKLELEFVHPDPVLAAHLGKQGISFMGRGVLEFIHPAEREQARHDLMNAIAADDLQGSVTRLRFARLSQIRAILGAPPAEIEYPYDAEAYVEDDEYLIIDLVLNWVADGLLLAFFHAIKDKDPVANNDPAKRDTEWSNFCGTANMGEDQIEALHRHISNLIPVPPKSRFPPFRIFQLHTTASSPTRPNSLVFSWPPPRPPGSTDCFDGLYDADEYTNLMRPVNMDPSQLATRPGEIRTSCTSRYGAKHSTSTEGVYRHIQSVFIPYGSLIFACFQTNGQSEIGQPHPQPRPAQPAQQLYGLMTPQQEWAGHGAIAPAHDWRPEDRGFGYDDGTRTPPGFQPQTQGQGQPPVHPQSQPPPPLAQPPHLSQPAHLTHVPHLQAYPTPSPGGPYPDSYGLSMDSSPPVQKELSASGGSGVNGGAGGGAAGGGGGGSLHTRPMVRPPGNVECCLRCGTRESPEWRRSESGIKDLCNACGLKRAREVAKREGRQKPRKKKNSDVR